MCGLRLRKSTIRLLLSSMTQIGEFDRILDKEDRNVVPYQIPISFLRVELHREPANVTREIR